jgi:hypothetical protein
LGYSVLNSNKRKHIIEVTKNGATTKILWEARGIDNDYEYCAFKQKGASPWHKIRTSFDRYAKFITEGCTEYWSWIKTPGRCESLPMLAMWSMKSEDLRVIHIPFHGTTESWVELGVEKASLYTNVEGNVVPMTWDDEFDDNSSPASQLRFQKVISAA